MWFLSSLKVFTAHQAMYLVNELMFLVNEKDLWMLGREAIFSGSF